MGLGTQDALGLGLWVPIPRGVFGNPEQQGKLPRGGAGARPRRMRWLSNPSPLHVPPKLTIFSSHTCCPARCYLCDWHPSPEPMGGSKPHHSGLLPWPPPPSCQPLRPLAISQILSPSPLFLSYLDLSQLLTGGGSPHQGPCPKSSQHTGKCGRWPCRWSPATVNCGRAGDTL